MPAALDHPPVSNIPASHDSGSLLPSKLSRSRPLFDPEIVRRATKESFVKLNPLTLLKNPVMFVVLVGSVLISGLWLAQLGGGLGVGVAQLLGVDVVPAAAGQVGAVGRGGGPALMI